jgi:hypothetical protein
MAAKEHMNGISASAVSGGRAPRGVRSLIVVAVWSAALAGGVLGVTALSGRDAPAPVPVPRHGGEQFNAPRLGGRVPTSFGSLTVSSVETLLGPARAMHLDKVPAGMHPIQLNLTINNIRQRSLAYGAGWFRLTGTRGSQPVGWSSHVGTMAPLSTKGLLLRVSVPVGDRLPQLEFRDPDGRAPVLIDLGSGKNLQTFNPATHQHGG